jgi:diketogulonate reductase-like aldo/keto reductase
LIYLDLVNDCKIPIIGLGTWRSEPNDAYNAVLKAIESGYRHIDTAAVYKNEEMIGKAIKDSKIPRSEIFLTTKLWNSDQGYQNTKKAFIESLKKLDTNYVDLYLIHWFKGYDLALETYRAIEELYAEGKIKAIGVSNFNIHHLQYLLDNSKIKPMVNQVETHIYLQNHFLHDFCKQNNIQLEAYAPLMSRKINELLANETLRKIAEKYNKNVVQVVLRWFIERRIVVIPKSITPERIEANIQIFDFSLDESDMAEIRKLNRGMKMFPEFDNIDY